jgi:uroporphyrinogen-III synthase
MRVWVTRDEENDGPLSAALRACGLHVVLEPVLEKRVVADAREIVGALGPDDWLVLTSPYAIEAAACRAARIPRVAVVGESSRRLAEAKGLRVELVSSQKHGQSLFEELRTRVSGGVVCYPRSSLAAVPEPWAGVELRCPILYETAARAFDRSVTERVDVVTVASPSAVRAVGAVDLPFASIGPTTSAELRRMGREPWVQAPQPTFNSLAAAIAAQAGDSRHHRA